MNPTVGARKRRREPAVLEYWSRWKPHNKYLMSHLPSASRERISRTILTLPGLIERCIWLCLATAMNWASTVSTVRQPVYPAASAWKSAPTMSIVVLRGTGTLCGPSITSAPGTTAKRRITSVLRPVRRALFLCRRIRHSKRWVIVAGHRTCWPAAG